MVEYKPLDSTTKNLTTKFHFGIPKTIAENGAGWHHRNNIFVEANKASYNICNDKYC